MNPTYPMTVAVRMRSEGDGGTASYLAAVFRTPAGQIYLHHSWRGENAFGTLIDESRLEHSHPEFPQAHANYPRTLAPEDFRVFSQAEVGIIPIRMGIVNFS